jgi:hypothetical protein
VSDNIGNVYDSTIIGRGSTITNSFNQVEREHGQDVSQALKQISDFIANSSNPSASSARLLFNGFAQELAKSQPEKSKLQQIWDDIKRVLPDIATISGSVAKVLTVI